jgi:hypothetical protein
MEVDQRKKNLSSPKTYDFHKFVGWVTMFFIPPFVFCLNSVVVIQTAIYLCQDLKTMEAQISVYAELMHISYKTSVMILHNVS